MATKTSKKPKKSFKTNLDKIRERYKQDGGGSGDWFKPKPGVKNKFRVLPQESGVYYLRVGMHYGFTQGGQKIAPSCPKIAGRGDCPICMVVDKLRASGDDYKKIIDAIRLKIKYVVNGIDRAEPDKVKMYGMSKKAWQTINEPMMDEEDPMDPTDPEEGYDMIITKEGEGMQTRYKERLAVKPSPIGDESEGWEEKMHDLDEKVPRWYKESEMIKLLKSHYGDTLAEVGIKLGKPTKDEPEEDEDEDEEEKPKKKAKPAPAKKRRPKDEDEDEEEEDDEDEDGEDEEDDDEDDE